MTIVHYHIMKTITVVTTVHVTIFLQEVMLSSLNLTKVQNLLHLHYGMHTLMKFLVTLVTVYPSQEQH